MILTYPLNVDYLIPDVRLHAGDYEDPPRFSDSIIRSAIIGGVKILQRYWKQRYLVFRDSMSVDPVPNDITVPSGFMYAKLPEGYNFIPSGLRENDIFRNPFHTFADPGSAIFSQEDEWPVILASIITLSRAMLSSSASSFQSWSDGEFSYSNIASSRILSDLYTINLKLLDDFFKKKLSVGLRDPFPGFIP